MRTTAWLSATTTLIFLFTIRHFNVGSGRLAVRFHPTGDGSFAERRRLADTATIELMYQ